jgi:hypothetical protein
MRRHLLNWLVAAVVPTAMSSCALIPKDLQFTDEFVAVLRRGGTTVKGVYRWSHHPFNFEVRQAATIWTDRGSVQIVVFDNPAAATQIEVVDQSKAERAPAHHFLISNWPDRGTVVWETNYPQYFTLRGNWFIVTYEPELNRRIKQALEITRPGRNKEPHEGFADGVLAIAGRSLTSSQTLPSDLPPNW